MHEGGYINYAVSQTLAFLPAAMTVNQRQVPSPQPRSSMSGMAAIVAADQEMARSADRAHLPTLRW